MGEAKRRKKLDPNFGKVRIYPKRKLPDLGSYLLDQYGEESCFLVIEDLFIPIIAYDSDRKIFSLAVLTAAEEKSHIGVFEFAGIEPALAGEIKQLKLSGFVGSMHPTKSKQYRTPDGRKIVPICPCKLEGITFYVGEDGDRFSIRAGKIVPGDGEI